MLDGEPDCQKSKGLNSLDGLLLVGVEDDFAEKTGGSIVHVNDDVLGASHSLESTLDQVGTSGSEDLVVRRSLVAKQLT